MVQKLEAVRLGTIKEHTGAFRMYGLWHWFSKSWCLSPERALLKGECSQRGQTPTEFVIPGKYGQKTKRENRTPEKPPANSTAAGNCDVTHSS